jgi:hypothetical protein
MDKEYHRKLVDLYAGRELPSELEADMEAAALSDSDLAVEMVSLRSTVDLLRAADDAPFTEESYQRIRNKLLVRGAYFEARSPEPAHLQYQLPIQG